jgi:hypothetical protein
MFTSLPSDPTYVYPERKRKAIEGRGVDYRLEEIKKGRVISDPASFFGIKVSLFLNLSP